MSTEYDQQHGQRGYQHYDQRGYQQYDQNGHEQYDQRGYQQYDQRDQQYSQSRSTILERGRAVRLMRNGDPFFPGRTFVINQKKYPMLEVFLDDASRTLRANFGAVRSIYTPKHGTRLQDISDFEDHRTYVAGGKEKFKKLHYLDIAEGKRVTTKGQASPKIQLPPVRHIDAEGRALKLSRSENVIIYVYRNGDPLTLPVKVLLVKPTLQNWESVLDEITKKRLLSNTAVLKLYAMNGELITSARQLEYNGMYVAGGKERFKRIDYPDPQILSPNASPKMSRKSVHPRIRLPPRQRRADDSNAQNHHQPSSSVTRHRYTKSDGTNTHTTTANSYGSTENTGQRRPPRDEYDIFNNKPQQHRRGPAKETDLDRDDGGIYKGRMNHRDRAREVDETHDTKIDFPIDYREAETVEEENLYGNVQKNSNRHHQLPPSQPFPDSRQPPIKSQTKHYDDYDNDNNNRHSYNNSRSNGYNDDHRRRDETPIDDDLIEQQLPHTTHRKPLISSSTQSNKKNQNQAAISIQPHVRDHITRKQTLHDQQPQHQMHAEESTIDQNHQPFQITERDYDDDHYNA